MSTTVPVVVSTPPRIDANPGSLDRQRRNWQKSAKFQPTGTLTLGANSGLTEASGSLAINPDGTSAFINGNNQLSSAVVVNATGALVKTATGLLAQTDGTNVFVNANDQLALTILAGTTVVQGGTTVIGTAGTVFFSNTPAYDNSGQLTITTSAGVSAAGMVAAITYGKSLTRAANLLLTPANGATATALSDFYISSSTVNGFVLSSDTLLSAGTTYILNYGYPR